MILVTVKVHAQPCVHIQGTDFQERKIVFCEQIRQRFEEFFAAKSNHVTVHFFSNVESNLEKIADFQVEVNVNASPEKERSRKTLPFRREGCLASNIAGRTNSLLYCRHCHGRMSPKTACVLLYRNDKAILKFSSQLVT